MTGPAMVNIFANLPRMKPPISNPIRQEKHILLAGLTR